MCVAAPFAPAGSRMIDVFPVSTGGVNGPKVAMANGIIITSPHVTHAALRLRVQTGLMHSNRLQNLQSLNPKGALDLDYVEYKRSLCTAGIRRASTQGSWLGCCAWGAFARQQPMTRQGGRADPCLSRTFNPTFWMCSPRRGCVQHGAVSAALSLYPSHPYGGLPSPPIGGGFFCTTAPICRAHSRTAGSFISK